MNTKLYSSFSLPQILLITINRGKFVNTFSFGCILCGLTIYLTHSLIISSPSLPTSGPLVADCMKTAYIAEQGEGMEEFLSLAKKR